MTQMESFFAPLTFLPAVGLLILSTSNRYYRVNQLIRQFSSAECINKRSQVKKELKRAELFRNALVGLYLSTGFFSLATLLASLLSEENARFVLKWFTIIGVSTLVFASLQLIYESFLSLQIIKKHVLTAQEESDKTSK